MFVRYYIVGYADDFDSVFIYFEACLFKRFTRDSFFEAFMEMHFTPWHCSCTFAVKFGTGFDGIHMPLSEKDFSLSEDHYSEADSYISVFCHALFACLLKLIVSCSLLVVSYSHMHIRILQIPFAVRIVWRMLS